MSSGPSSPTQKASLRGVIPPKRKPSAFPNFLYHSSTDPAFLIIPAFTSDAVQFERPPYFCLLRAATLAAIRSASVLYLDPAKFDVVLEVVFLAVEDDELEVLDFVVVEDVNDIVAAYSNEYGFAKQKSALIEKLTKAQLNFNDLEFDENKIILEINGNKQELERKMISKATKYINF